MAVSPVQQEGRSALLVIDTSGSMGERGIAAARQAAGAYLSQAPDDVRVGLVTFADAPHLLVPPTSQRATVRAALGRLAAQGETTLYDAYAARPPAAGQLGQPQHHPAQRRR